jgi:hypothetical protein
VRRIMEPGLMIVAVTMAVVVIVVMSMRGIVVV